MILRLVKRLKENIKAILKANVLESGVLRKEEGIRPSSGNAGLSFEQQKELLILQLEHNKLKQQEEPKVQLELEKIKFKTEQTK